MSLRTRLLLLTTGLMAAGLVAGNTVVIGALQDYLVGRIDDQLHPVADIFSRAPRPGPAEPGPRPNPALRNAGMDFLGNPYVAELSSEGDVERELLPSGRPARSLPATPVLDRAAVASRDGRPFNIRARDGGTRWRAIVLPRRTPRGGSVLVAIPQTMADDTIDRLRMISLTTGVALLAVLALAGIVTVRVGLRPLRRIEDTAAAIAAGDLSRRIPDLASSRTEVGRLAAALNGMLAQLDAAFAARAESQAKLRRFVADVSHELRTPLFGIKGFTELYRMGGLPERADIDRTMTRIEAESTRLARLTEDLLLLAQFGEAADDGDHDRLQLGPTDLRTLASDARHELRALDPSRTVDLTGPDGGPVDTAQMLGDEARLRQVVANLAGNVIAHTPSGTAVRIGVGTQDGHAILEIEDSGPGLTQEQADRVFDRFYRADRSRRGGAGLGLAIVESIVTAHGGHVELRTAPGEGATFRIVFPVLTAEAARQRAP